MLEAGTGKRLIHLPRERLDLQKESLVRVAQEGFNLTKLKRGKTDRLAHEEPIFSHVRVLTSLSSLGAREKVKKERADERKRR